MPKILKPVSWETEEYIVRDHDTIWYIGFFIVVAVLGIIAVLLDAWSFLILVILSAIAILIYSFRPPRKLHYLLDENGITEETKFHSYDEFRAFGILKEGNNYSAFLVPKKRLSLGLKVYFPEGKGEAIVDQLGNHLKMEDIEPDFLDKLISLLRI
ncbi:MAG: hypothetical protein Q4A79_02830 [Candidatus Saccharibacteria bacterium]|nr:hypothetical protein [Candidatus Saccharibacteria bacterium]